MKKDNSNQAHSESDIARNMFTSMITVAFDRYIVQYKKRIEERQEIEFSCDDIDENFDFAVDNIEKTISDTTYDNLDNLALYAAMKKLNDLDAKILYLHVIEDKSFDVIAAELGITPTYITTLYSRLKKTIQNEVKKLNGLY